MYIYIYIYISLYMYIPWRFHGFFPQTSSLTTSRVTLGLSDPPPTTNQVASRENLKKKLSNRSSEILWYPSKKVPGPLFNPPKKKPFKRGLGHRRCNMGLILKGGLSQGFFPLFSLWRNQGDEMMKWDPSNLYLCIPPSSNLHLVTPLKLTRNPKNWSCRRSSFSKEYFQVPVSSFRGGVSCFGKIHGKYTTHIASWIAWVGLSKWTLE